MTSECKSMPQMATLTTDAVPIPSPEVPNAHTEVVSEGDPVQNQLEGNDSHDSSESEDSQEHIPRGEEEETGNVKPIEVEMAGAQALPPPEVSEDKANKTVETPTINNPKEKKKKPANDRRIVQQNNSLLPAPSVLYSIKNATGLHFGPNITINLSSKKEKSPKLSPKRIPRDVEEMFRSTVPVTEEDLDTVSSHVGRGWRQVGRRLNFSDGKLDQYKADFNLEGRKEVIYQMLLDWKREKNEKATRGVLCSALWSSDQCDAVEKLVHG